MDISKVTESDLNDISTLIQETIKTYSESTSLLEKFSEENLKKKLPSRDIFKLEVQGEMVGTVTLKEDLLLALFVSTDQQGKGYGKVLATYLEEYALSKGVSTLYTPARNEVADFYLSLGYIKLDKEEDAMLREKYKIQTLEVTMLKKVL